MAKQIRLYFGYHTGHNSKMAVKLALFFYNTAAKCLEHETVELESAAQGCVHIQFNSIQFNSVYFQHTSCEGGYVKTMNTYLNQLD